MKIPDGCYNCQFKHYSPPTGLTVCTITGNILADFQRPLQFIGRADTCTLFEIPSHGRLIDADKLCNRLLMAWDIADKEKKTLISAVMADIVTTIVVGTPTIIPSDGSDT